MKSVTQPAAEEAARACVAWVATHGTHPRGWARRACVGICTTVPCSYSRESAGPAAWLRRGGRVACPRGAATHTCGGTWARWTEAPRMRGLEMHADASDQRGRRGLDMPTCRTWRMERSVSLESSSTSVMDGCNSRTRSVNSASRVLSHTNTTRPTTPPLSRLCAPARRSRHDPGTRTGCATRKTRHGQRVD